MRIGTSYDEVGSRYPFDESSELVSPFPTTSPSMADGLIPCNLFSDVVIDRDDLRYSVFLSGVRKSSQSEEHPDLLSFVIVDDKGEDEDVLFQISWRDFDRRGRALYVSGHVIMQLETRLGSGFRTTIASLLRFLPMPDETVRIGFDSRCYRTGESRLRSFVVGDEVVSGDVVLQAGYNTEIADSASRTGASNGILVAFVPGGGDGVTPCPEPQQIPKLGVLPDSNGAIRIDTDGCYSVLPIDSNKLSIIGHCSACCTCEGDYLPAAKATIQLINRIVAAANLLDSSNRRYELLVKAYQGSVEDKEKMSISMYANLYRQKSNNTFVMQVSAALTSMSIDPIIVKEISVRFDSQFGSKTFKFSDLTPTENHFWETRVLQYGGGRYRGGSARLPVGGIKLEAGEAIRFTSEFHGSAVDIGRSVFYTTSVVVSSSYAAGAAIYTQTYSANPTINERE